VKDFDESPQMNVFTLHAEWWYAQCIQQLPPAEERMIIFALPSLPDLHAQTA